MIQAMGDLASKFAHSKDQTHIRDLFLHFFRIPDNQYSYQNTWVYDQEGEILGSLNAYDGGKLEMLRAPFLNYLKATKRIIKPNAELETEPGEFYLDTVSVHPITQGKGIGRQLMVTAISEAKDRGYTKVALLVEPENLKAVKLYQSIGFTIHNKKIFFGNEFHHMIFNIS